MRFIVPPMPELTQSPDMSGEAVAPALSTHQDDSTFRFDKVAVQDKPRHHLSLQEDESYVDRVNEYYSTDEIADFLRGKDSGVAPQHRPFKRITLQFPDALICDSATVVHELQKKLGLAYDTQSLKEGSDNGVVCNTVSNGNESCCSSYVSNTKENGDCSNNISKTNANGSCCSNNASHTNEKVDCSKNVSNTNANGDCSKNVSKTNANGDCSRNVSKTKDEVNCCTNNVSNTNDSMDCSNNTSKTDDKMDCSKNVSGTNEKVGCCSNKSSGCSDPTDITDQRIWILADTSYSACCIDEVAAEHVHSDLVIHFGDACLNPVDKLPALYVFGRPRVDFEILAAKFKQHYTESTDKILLMADAPYTTVLKRLHDKLKPEYPNLAYADLYTDPESKTSIVGYEPSTTEDNIHVFNRSLLHMEEVDTDDIDATLGDYHLFHITVPEAPRLLQLTTRFESVVTYDPHEERISSGPFPNLMRRYRYMHMARAAGTVGLLVNTLSLANTKKLINNMGKKLREAGKKHYIFVVGKPNVAKLANFENVDIWCILGCDHQGIIIDQHNEYFKPIVTPYELMLALNYELSWTGKWVTDFRNILQDLEDASDVEEEAASPKHDDDYEDEAPEFNPVTGQYASESRPLRRLQHLQITSHEETPDDASEQHNSLVKKFSSTVAIKNTVSTSAIHLQNRHWTGLGSDWRADDSDEEVSQEGARVEEGRGGIARGYDYDRQVHH